MLHSVILAGGKSSRMGRSKAALKVKGQTLLQRSLTLLQDIGSERVLLSLPGVPNRVPPAKLQDADLERALLSGGVKASDCVPDLLPDGGPVTGIHSAMAHIGRELGLDGSSLLAVPVDMPLLNVEALRRLLAAGTGRQCVHYRGFLFPCLLKVSREVHECLEALCRAGLETGRGPSMQVLFRNLQSQALDSGEFPDEIFTNVNSPQDLARARKTLE